MRLLIRKKNTSEMKTEFDLVDIERTKQELQATRRELSRALDAHRAETARRDSEISSLRSTNDSLQASVDNLTVQRNKESRQRADQSKQIEELRMENMKLRRDIAAALDTRSSHLRVPQVSFDQYRELVSVLEVYQGLLAGGNYDQSNQSMLGGGGGGGLGAAQVALVSQAKTRIERMESAPFVLSGGTQQQAFSTSAFVDPNSSATDYRGGGVGASPTSSPQQASSFKDRSAIASPSGSAAYVPSANVPSSTTTRTNATKDGKLVSIKTEMPRKGDEPAESHISIQNTTSDQYIVEYTFSSNSNVEAVGDTVVDGRTFRLNLYPHETKPFVCGIISGYKMSCRFGPPDEGYVPSTSLTDADLLPLVNRVRTVWRRSPAGTDVAEIASLCRNEGTPFIDIDFPPVSSAMVRSFELMQDEAPPIVMWFPPEKWLPKDTPAELCRSAVNPTALATSTDCDNGWLVSGMAALAEDPNLVGQIFSPTLASDEQMGLYSVWINKHGLWNIVTVDSYLPCRDVSSPQSGGNGANGSGGNSGGNHNNDPNNRQSSSSRHRAKGGNVTKYQLFGARAKSDENDIWPAILEKVFAKCHGSYYSLRHGDVLEALQDLTGFPVEKFDWTRDRDTSVFPSIHKALSTHLSHSHSTETAQGSSNIVMLATTTSAVSDSKVIRSIGLEPNGAFRVLAAVAVDQFRLILIRVSLKYEGHAWTGNWSEASDMWRRYPNAHKACQAAAANIEDIESCIWMEWRDVARYFGGCGVCYCRPHWLDVRIGNRFQKNKPACMVQVYVGGGGTRMFLGIHQKDRRGLPNTDPDHLYGAFLLTVVAAGATAGTWEILAQSHGGTFWRGRDAFLDVTFPPSQQPYYIIPRRYSAEGIKDTVLSLHVEHREVVTMALLETSDEVLQSLRYTPLNKFNPTADALPISRVDCQLDREPATQLAW